MTENNNELPRLHILVDASKVVRCKWCGTTQSEKWIPTEPGSFFCSYVCVKAYGHDRYWMILTPLICLIPLFVGVFLLASDSEKGFVGFVGLLTCGITLSMAWCTYEDREYAKDVPQNSRLNEGLSDLSLLKTITSHAVCPNCDGNLDLSKVTQDMVYDCEYCGASGKIEVVKMKQ